MGARARHRGLWDRPRPAVGDGVRGRRRGEAVWNDAGHPARANRPPRPAKVSSRTTGGPTQPDPPVRARRSSSTAARIRPRRRAGRRRGPLHGDLEPRVHAGPGRRGPGGPRRAPGEEHRYGVEPRARRHAAAGSGQRLRDRPVRPVAGGGESLSGKHHGHDERDDVSLKVDRGARPGDDVPDRGRGPAGQRRTRLHPAPDAPPGGHALPAARHRGTGVGAARSAAPSS